MEIPVNGQRISYIYPLGNSILDKSRTVAIGFFESPAYNAEKDHPDGVVRKRVIRPSIRLIKDRLGQALAGGARPRRI